MGEVAFFTPIGDWQVYGMSTTLPVKSVAPLSPVPEADGAPLGVGDGLGGGD
jgi:hypothetical protein